MHRHRERGLVRRQQRGADRARFVLRAEEDRRASPLARYLVLDDDADVAVEEPDLVVVLGDEDWPAVVLARLRRKQPGVLQMPLDLGVRGLDPLGPHA